MEKIKISKDWSDSLYEFPQMGMIGDGSFAIKKELCELIDDHEIKTRKDFDNYFQLVLSYPESEFQELVEGTILTHENIEGIIEKNFIRLSFDDIEAKDLFIHYKHFEKIINILKCDVFGLANGFYRNKINAPLKLILNNEVVGFLASADLSNLIITAK